MKLLVDKSQRLGKMRAHTATHLLHYALEQVLGSTKQAGSLVDCDYLRFDFAAKNALSLEQLSTINTMINERIVGGFDVTTQECSLSEAKELGAKAFFEEKYGETVRVVSIHDSASNKPLRSIELCGGTHVKRTDHIGAFVIQDQEAVASGIRRITAYTGTKVSDFATEQTKIIADYAAILSAQPKQLGEKIEKILKENSSLNDTISSLQQSLLTSSLKTLTPLSGDNYFDYKVDCDALGITSIGFKEIVAITRGLYADYNVLIFTQTGTFAIYSGKSDDAKTFAQKHNLRGGGNDTIVQGKDTSIIDQL